MLTIVGTGMSNYKLDGMEKYIKENDFVVLHKYYTENNDPSLLEGKNVIVYARFRHINIQIKEVLSKDKNASIVCFVTGSPLFYSGGTAIIYHLLKELPGFNKQKDARIVDNISSKNYLLSKLEIKDKDVFTMTCHGGQSVDLSLFLKARYTLVIAHKDTLFYIKDVIRYLDKNDYSVTIGSKLGYKDKEKIETIDELTDDVALKGEEYMPYVVLIERRYDLSDKLYYAQDFNSDEGMITKRDTRHLLLSYLELKENQILWDIGAGSGSIGISAYKMYKVSTVFFEKKEKRANDIEKNLAIHKVLGATVRLGDALTNIAKERSKPHRIVIGGGGASVSNSIHTLYDRLVDGGVIVAIYVTLESFISAFNTLKEQEIPFSTKAFSYTDYNKNKVLIAEPQRLSFLIKIQKEYSKNE